MDNFNILKLYDLFVNSSVLGKYEQKLKDIDEFKENKNLDFEHFDKKISFDDYKLIEQLLSKENEKNEKKYFIFGFMLAESIFKRDS